MGMSPRGHSWATLHVISMCLCKSRAEHPRPHEGNAVSLH